jgi:hypothetical protein
MKPADGRFVAETASARAPRGGGRRAVEVRREALILSISRVPWRATWIDIW